MRKRVYFDIEGIPPSKSKWSKDDADLIIKLRENALQARQKKGFDIFHGPIKLTLIIYAPNITNIDYKHSGSKDPNRFVGNLENLVSRVCEYLQAAPTNPDDDIIPIFNRKKEIGPSIPLLIKHNSQLVEISAKKIYDHILHYRVEIESIM